MTIAHWVSDSCALLYHRSKSDSPNDARETWRLGTAVAYIERFRAAVRERAAALQRQTDMIFSILTPAQVCGDCRSTYLYRPSSGLYCTPCYPWCTCRLDPTVYALCAQIIRHMLWVEHNDRGNASGADRR